MNAADPVEFVLSLNGTETACTQAGSGPPLLLIHGAEGSRKSFARLSARLAADFTVIGYDQRDCGDTVNAESAATIADLAADAQALIHALGHSRASVFGSSFGGRVAQMLAIAHPQAVERLVLGSTWAIDEALASQNRGVVERATMLRERLPASAAALAEIFFPPHFLQAQPAFLSHFTSAPARTARTARRAATVAQTAVADPAAITARTLLLAGTLDLLVPAALTERLAARIAGARLERLEGIGHISYVQAPERVAALLRAFCPSQRQDA